MNDSDYWNQVVALCRKSGDCHQALRVFLENKPRPSGIELLEYNKLRTEYAEALREWTNFSEKYADSRSDEA